MTAKEPTGSVSKKVSRVRESFKKRTHHLVPVDTKGLTYYRAVKAKVYPSWVQGLGREVKPTLSV